MIIGYAAPGVPRRTIRALAVFVALAMSTAACTASDGGRTPTPTAGGALAPEGALGLVTDEAVLVTVWDAEALRSDAPREVR